MCIRDRYTWVDKGSSYLPSDMNAAYLWGQLEAAQTIYDDRMATWHAYNDAFADLAAEGLVELPVVPDDRVQNAHMYYLLLPTLEDRTSFCLLYTSYSYLSRIRGAGVLRWTENQSRY